MRKFLAGLKEKTVPLNYGRDVITGFAGRHAARGEGPLKILDVGLGTAADILNVRAALAPLPCELFGIDAFEPNLAAARGHGISVSTVDIERDALPYAAAFLDIVIANQVVEHTKEIFWIFSEFSRVLKPGGIAIVGVPNLASLHNRVLLLMGLQPSSIELLGPHVRGITRGSFENFISTDGYFEVLETRGANFYPFPAPISDGLARMFPNSSVSLFFCLRRTAKKGVFIEVLSTRFFETNYYTGGRTG